MEYGEGEDKDEIGEEALIKHFRRLIRIDSPELYFSQDLVIT
jgi:hypothetical protein